MISPLRGFDPNETPISVGTISFIHSSTDVFNYYVGTYHTGGG